MSFDEQLERAFDNLTDRLTTEVAHQVRVVVDDVAAAWRAERDKTVASLVPDHASVVERLAADVRALSARTSLTGVLDALLDAASREAGRAGLFLVQADRFRSWRTTGFGTFGAAGDEIEFGREDAGLIGDAGRSRATTVAGPEGRSNFPAFAHLDAGAIAVAAPLVVAGQVVAVLYADHLSSGIHALDLLATHAGRCLEARTALQLTRAAAAPSVTEQARAVDEGAAAQRYARLLVSEIKLYHQKEVQAGLHGRDLSTRLATEIAQAREQYDQRMPVGLGRAADYFQAELVRTLADGDAGALGAGTAGGGR
jgi:hypothetical protein